MRKTILSSILVTSFITFTLTTINTNTKNTIDFVFLWAQSWLIAATISCIFNIYIIPFLFKKKRKLVLMQQTFLKSSSRS
ncbi:DUF2798 domain-containing protein [Flavobacterium sp. K5-23]|nr:DUF2798 domain-containing protein [Flavobacterium sp. K5-23]